MTFRGNAIMLADLNMSNKNITNCTQISGKTVANLGEFTNTIASAVSVLSIAGSTYNNIQQTLSIFHSAGYISGGTVTDNGNGTVNISALEYLIRSTDSHLGTLYHATFAASTNVALTDNSLNWIYINYNGGTPNLVVSTSEPADVHTMVAINKIYRAGTSLIISSSAVRAAVGDHASHMIERMNDTMPFAKVSGGTISATGTRNFAISTSVFWVGMTKITIPSFNSATGGTFTYVYRNGAGNFTFQTAQTQINNTQYDDGTGVLASLSNTKYGNHWVYINETGTVWVLFGRGNYTSAEAAAATAPTPVPNRMFNAVLLGRITIIKSATTFDSIAHVTDSTLISATAQNAASISFSNVASGLAALDVQSAIDEVVVKKLNLTGGTLTGAIALPAGSAALPSLTFTGDTNTGIYSDVADQVVVSCGGAATVRATNTATSFTYGGTETITFNGTNAIMRCIVRPAITNTNTLGTTALRWSNIYSVNVTGSNAYTNDSDARMKRNIVNMELGLSFIRKLRPVSYQWNNVDANGDYQDNKHMWGFVAQEVYGIVCEHGFDVDTCNIVGNQALSEPSNPNAIDSYNIAYAAITPLLVNSIKEIDSAWEEMEAKLSEQSQTIAKLTAELVEEKRARKMLEDRVIAIESFMASTVSR